MFPVIICQLDICTRCVTYFLEIIIIIIGDLVRTDFIRVENRGWIDSFRFRYHRGGRIASNRPTLAANHFSDATDLTALPFDQLPTTFSIALPFLHRPLIVGIDVATSVTPPWARHRERERKREQERQKRPRDQDGRTFIRRRKERGERGVFVSDEFASRRIARDTRFIVCRDFGKRARVRKYRDLFFFSAIDYKDCRIVPRNVIDYHDIM